MQENGTFFRKAEQRYSRIRQPHALTDDSVVIGALGASALPTNVKFAGTPSCPFDDAKIQQIFDICKF